MDEETGPDRAPAPGATRYAAFLLRVWADDGGSARMVVQQIGRARLCAFSEWDGVIRHVQELIEAPPIAEDGGPLTVNA